MRRRAPRTPGDNPIGASAGHRATPPSNWNVAFRRPLARRLIPASPFLELWPVSCALRLPWRQHRYRAWIAPRNLKKHPDLGDQRERHGPASGREAVDASSRGVQHPLGRVQSNTRCLSPASKDVQDDRGEALGRRNPNTAPIKPCPRGASLMNKTALPTRALKGLDSPGARGHVYCRASERRSPEGTGPGRIFSLGSIPGSASERAGVGSPLAPDRRREHRGARRCPILGRAVQTSVHER